MRKIKNYKGYVIATSGELYHIFTKEEWSMGEGYRYEEMEAGSVSEAEDWIDDEVREDGDDYEEAMEGQY